jgi:hypothetical protein
MTTNLKIHRYLSLIFPFLACTVKGSILMGKHALYLPPLYVDIVGENYSQTKPNYTYVGDIPPICAK